MTARREQAGVDLVIFDCDGVLVDSETIGIGIDQRMLAELGWRLSRDELVDRFVGLTDGDFRAQVEERLSAALDPDWYGGYRERYEEAFDAELRAVEHIRSALDAIPHPVCVASNGTRDRIRRSLRLTGLLDRFDGGHMFSAQDVPRGKPAPDLFLHAAERMGAGPAGCVVIEDSRPGVAAARAAGMRVLGFGGSVTPPERLRAAGATVFGSMRELPGLVAGLSH